MHKMHNQRENFVVMLICCPFQNPNYIRNTTTENIGSDGKRLPMEETNGAAKRYIATLTLGQTGITTTKDTGRYNCLTASPETGMKYKTISAYYHVYVPGGFSQF